MGSLGFKQLPTAIGLGLERRRRVLTGAKVGGTGPTLGPRNLFECCTQFRWEVSACGLDLPIAVG
jgi:hypothetical protein